MLRFMVIILVFINSACTARLTQKAFIAKESEIINYAPSDIEQWQQDFSSHQLTQVELETKDKSAILKGMLLDHSESNELIFLIQGNGMKISHGGMSMLKHLALLNKDIIIFDHRGLGASTGEPTIDKLISDASEQYDFINEKLSPKTIVVHGYSLGSFIATQLAKKKLIDALVLQGAATNVAEWIDVRTPWYAKLFLNVDIEPVFYTVDNKTIIKQDYIKPLLIIAGEKDEQTPAILSERLFEASQSLNKKLVVVDGANHQTMFNSPKTMEMYQIFLNSL